MSKRILWMFLLLLTLSGCSLFPSDEEEEVPDQPPEVFYREGVEAVQAEKFKTATEKFTQLDKRHPASPWATRAQLNLIYTHYKQREFAETVSAAERFIRLNPRHPHTAYAFYMRGLANYQQISDAYRDQGHTREAIAAFREVMSRYPQSDYAWQAERMLVLCNDRLAEQEMVVGRYYLDQEEFIAASNRFRTVVEEKKYQTTPYVEEALFSLSYASLKLGLGREARDYAAVLGHNYPESPFYNQAIKLLSGQGEMTTAEIDELRQGVEEGSFLRRFFEGLTPGLPGMTDSM